MEIGYVRVSSWEHNGDRQMKALVERGILKENIYMDEWNGEYCERPKLQALLNVVKRGDVVYVTSISRIARDITDLIDLINTLNKKGIGIASLNESINTTTSQGKMLAAIFASMYEMERENIQQRKEEERAIEQLKGGKYGRPKQEISESFIKAYKRWKEDKITATAAMKLVGMKRNTFYRRVKEYESAM